MLFGEAVTSTKLGAAAMIIVGIALIRMR